MLVTDLIVKDNDVVVSTQGRSFWILDDVSPLRQASAAITAGDAFLFKPRRPTASARPLTAPRPEPALRRGPLLLAEGGAEGQGGGDARDPGRAGKLVRKISSKEESEAPPPADDDDGPPQAAAPPKLPAKAA